ncbi:hypothetical protein LZP73_02755 [Shewanella sp. AS16]|uniref:hypothetical protein n=1 Tax=Shewanella sp. AS16 TaxID=2907625 RepID=UPI001F1ECCE5|nr:hypothetical protein [Shewanella sp. AS16]MCE9685132.1 hypothetical protein [Shewanella sp. AS16]
MIEMIFQYIYEFKFEIVYKLLNSQFMSSVIGTLTGAFAGAYAAHKIGMGAKRRELLEAQMRYTNVATSSAFLTCNTVLGLKSQHIQSMYTSYIFEKDNFETALRNPPASEPIHFEMDLKVLHMPFVPFDDVSGIIQGQVNVRGRSLALVSTIKNSLTSLSEGLEYRNRLIDQLKTKFQGLQEEHKLKIYFGLPLPDGNIHQEYSDTLPAIYQYIDDVIFFSSLLCSDLVEHGEKIRAQYRKEFGRHLEKTTSPNFKTEKADKLMPDAKDYEDWLNMFQELPQEQPWFKRVWLLTRLFS